ncbi:PREDICTED: apoptotic chromatin condensation inducer in the nucleus-like [Pseudopodoces humilis]|uniref:apoptotic chromatin condensation inducer in the nucleus-like n=1 Tax=Pseudopodoces humilis TaxID=181119 RepID=UPI0006B7CC38|nr:PREDICTED: apoptotic chromatin condensation inducer in the nucleus-like [Pseudopodoces humilis]
MPLPPPPCFGPAPVSRQATPRGFKRKIAVLSARGSLEPEGGGAGAGGPRKRRWGATTPKKPSINISTDSLKGLIPDIRGGAGAEPADPPPESSVGVAGSGGEGPEPEVGEPGGVASSSTSPSGPVRPFTLGQLKELLGRTGRLKDDGFWIDRIKSHCFVTYCSVEEAVATREALHGVKWPQSNPKVLAADFAQQEELDFHRGLLAPPPGSSPSPLTPRPSPWAERERERSRRERAREQREWDRGKSPAPSGTRPLPPGGGAAPGHAPRDARGSRGRIQGGGDKEKGRGQREARPERKEKPPEEPPAKLLDDLFRKTKAAPCIYWLPLTDSQLLQKQAERAARARERERRRKEQEEEELRQRQMGGASGGGVAGGGGASSTSGPAHSRASGGGGASQRGGAGGSRKRRSRSRSPPSRGRR